VQNITSKTVVHSVARTTQPTKFRSSKASRRSANAGDVHRDTGERGYIISFTKSSTTRLTKRWPAIASIDEYRAVVDDRSNVDVMATFPWLLAIAGQRFVNRVVDDFVNEMM